ncbi:MAG TPA: cytochrome c-type biogenesis protein CcmH [Vicinamibacteria bacterium]|jgi:cytochrome c-type biogenesis protein CcmH/NrfF
MKWLERSLPLVVLFAGLSTLLAQERLSTPEYREATSSLMCQCGGCSATVYTCAMEHCHSAEPIREEIAERIQKGESVASILQVFEERYGLGILAAPPARGFHLTAWIAPLLVLLIGFFVTRSVLLSWKRETAAAGGTGTNVVDMTPPPISDSQRARIEKELRDLSS